MKYAFSIVAVLLFVVFNLQASVKPNIVIILSDDLDDRMTPKYFDEVLPAVSRMKAEGINFDNSFVSVSVCCPSRAGLLSGKFANKTGVYNNIGKYGGWKEFKDDEPNAMPVYFVNQGYETALIGKYFNGYKVRLGKVPPIPYGWTSGLVPISGSIIPYQGYDYKTIRWNNGKPASDTEWDANKQVVKFGSKESDYSTDVYSREGQAFIRQSADKNKPFLLLLTPTAPHYPLAYAPRHKEMALKRWVNEPMPVLPNTFTDKGKMDKNPDKAVPEDKSSWLKRTWKKRLNALKKHFFFYWIQFNGKIDKEVRGRGIAEVDFFYRMASLYALNDLVEDVIKELKATGQWENTLLIFTSDNGFQFGNHGLYQKHSPYEEALRVPLVMLAGDSLKLNSEQQFSEMVFNLDILPTILQLSGIQVPDDIDGKSLLPYISVGKTPEEPKPFGRDKLVYQYKSPGLILPRFFRIAYYWIIPYAMDIPSYTGIRKKVKMDNGDEAYFKYIEYYKHTNLRHWVDKLEEQDEELWAKLEKGDKKTFKKLKKALEKEVELYNLAEDPYEMDNLLYYEPEKYRELTEKLRTEMYDELFHTDKVYAMIKKIRES